MASHARRKPLKIACDSFGSNHLFSFCCLAGMLVGKIIFSMVFAKVFITISFDLVYVYSAELFPTVIR